ELVKFGGGVSQSVFNPIVLMVVLVAGLLICVLGRRKGIVPFLVTAVFIPIDQIVLVGGFYFFLVRGLVFFWVMFLIKSCLSSLSLSSWHPSWCLSKLRDGILMRFSAGHKLRFFLLCWSVKVIIALLLHLAIPYSREVSHRHYCRCSSLCGG